MRRSRILGVLTALVLSALPTQPPAVAAAHRAPTSAVVDSCKPDEGRGVAPQVAAGDLVGSWPGAHSAPRARRLGVPRPRAAHKPYTDNDSVGLVYGEDAKGRCTYCTASVVLSPAGQSVLATAAHCIYVWDPKENGAKGRVGWLEHVFFVPAYQKGKRPPYGVFPIHKAAVEPGWYLDGSVDSDLAFLGADPDTHHRKVADLVTQYGLEFNADFHQEVKAFGYFDSLARLTSCSGRTKLAYPAIKKIVRFSRCQVSHGSSGGPWYARYTGGYGYLDGVTESGNIPDDPDDYVYSTYFDDVAYDTYRRVTG
ncbi:V8-like Glu-specific endopeptidase [Streptacidiphilus sp. MAP12-33]|uniref:trypsin-like serine peptidase n=1 Tax=Streptacidiphilus sp. MAP12-33 TaxID=3156266 RepID=UPI003512CE22